MHILLNQLLGNNITLLYAFKRKRPTPESEAKCGENLPLCESQHVVPSLGVRRKIEWVVSILNLEM